ncbi:MAG: hypothetical protein J6X18_06835 [Bacteroidales bacterium]|nr:hypothetical protein [Bacteroidales bacterium]
MNINEWMKVSKPAVDFLQNVYGVDYTTVAKIITMQAEQDVDGLCAVLEEVSEFCERRINELQETKNEKPE